MSTKKKTTYSSGQNFKNQQEAEDYYSNYTTKNTSSGLSYVFQAMNAINSQKTTAQQTAAKQAATQRAASGKTTSGSLMNRSNPKSVSNNASMQSTTQRTAGRNAAMAAARRELSEQQNSVMHSMLQMNQDEAYNASKTVTKKSLASSYTNLEGDEKEAAETYAKAVQEYEAIRKNNVYSSALTGNLNLTSASQAEAARQQMEEAKKALQDYGWSDSDINWYGKNYSTLKGMQETEAYENKRSTALQSVTGNNETALKEYINAKSEYDSLLNSSNPLADRTRTAEAGVKLEKARETLKSYGWTDDQIAKNSQYYSEQQDKEKTESDTEAYKEWINNHGFMGGVAATAASVAASPFSGIQAMTEVLKSYGYADKDAPVNTNSSAYYLKNLTEAGQEQTSENIGNWAYDKTGSKFAGNASQFLYGVGVSTADSLLAVGLGAGIVGELGLTGTTARIVANAVTLPSFGASAFTTTLKEDQDAGLGKKNALAHATGTGIAEMLTEVVSLDKLWDTYSVAKAGDASIRWMITNAFAGAGIEGSEEVASDLIGWYVDSLVNGGLSEYGVNKAQYMRNGKSEEEAARLATMDYIKQAGQDFAAGALSGALSNAVTAGTGYVRSVHLASAVMDNQTAKEAIIEHAKKMDEGTTARKIADSKEVKDITKEDVRQMVVSMESAAQEESSVEEIVEDALVEEGLTREEAKQEAPDVVNIIQEGYMEDLDEDLAEDLEEENSNYLESHDEAAQVVGKVATGEVNLTESRPATMGAMEAARALEEKQTKKAEAKKAAVSNTAGRTTGSIKSKLQSGVAQVTIDGKNDYMVGFSQDKEGNTTFKLAGNRTVNPQSVEIEDENTRQVVESAMQMGSTQASNAFMQSYNGEPVETYSRAGFAAYTAGVIGTSFKDMMDNPINDTWTAVIPEATVRKMYEIGRNERKNRLQQEKTIQEKKKEADQNRVREKKKKNTGTFTDQRTHKDDNRLADVCAAVSKATGLDIVLTDKLSQGENGHFSAALGRIAISEESVNGYGTLVHEMMEYANEYNPEAMQKVFDSVLEYVSTSYGTEWTGKQIKRYQETYRKVEANKEFGSASEEFVYDFVAGVFMQEEGIKDFTNFLEKNYSETERKTILQTIADFFQGLAQKIRDFINESNIKGINRKGLETDAYYAEEIRDIVLKTMQGAVNKSNLKGNATSITEENAEQYVEALKEGDSELFEEILDDDDDLYEEPEPETVEYSLALDDDLMDRAYAKNEIKDRKGKVIGHTVSPMDMQRAQAARKAMKTALEKVKQYLPEDNAGKVVVNNSSYSKSVENSMVCVRSIVNNYFIDEVAERIGRPLTVEEQLVTSQILAEVAGDQRECNYCYVATDRRTYKAMFTNYYNEYIDQINRVKENREAYEKDKDYGYEEFLKGRKATKEMKKRYLMFVNQALQGKQSLQLSDLTTAEKRTVMKVGSKERTELIADAEKYCQAATWQKKTTRKVGKGANARVLDYIAYDGEILNWKPDVIDKLNSQFGLRMYSFSDYVPQFILENMQEITDAAVRGLKMLAYTKDIGFAEVFAPTGMGINVSVFGEWSDDLGTVVQDGMMGADWDRTKELRDTYDNVGAVFVATSDKAVEWGLEQDWIDVVIPYHLVRTGTQVAKFFGYTNYKAVQEDKKGAGWQQGMKKSISPVDHENSRDKYFQELNDNHLTPRFESWKDHKNYMKLVNETRMSYKDMNPVKPVFDMEAAYREVSRIKYEGLYGTLQGMKTQEEQKEFLDDYADRAVKAVREYSEGKKYSITVPDDENFGMKAPRENKGDLIAIHNLTEEQLTEQLKIGGMASPSIAIVHASQGHTNFGEISVVLSKDSIDPKKTSLNRVYGADAYTPSVRNGDVSYKVNPKAAEKVYDILGELHGEIPNVLSGSVSSWEQMFNGTATGYTLKDIRDKGYTIPGLKAAYLVSEGTKVEPEYSTVEKGYDEEKTDLYESIIKKIGESAVRASRMPITQWIKDYNLEVIREMIDVDQSLPKSFQNRQAYKTLREAEKYLNREDSEEKVIDAFETINKVDRLVEPKKTEFKKWVDQITDGLIDKKGIWNGKDPYTEYGSRRTFEQTHDEWTPENIVRYLYKTSGQSERGQGLSVKAEGIQAVTAKKYTSIAQIKKDAQKRLSRLNQQDYQDMMNEEDEKVTEMLNRVREDSGRYPNAQEVFPKTANAKDPEAIQNAMKRLGYNITRATAESMYDLYREIAELPTAYFEAKPKRVVGIDEIQMVVVPDDISDETRKTLDESGVRWQTYESGNDQERIEKVNELDDLKFSVPVDADEDGQIFSTDQSEVNSILAAGLEATKTVPISEKATKKIAREILQKYESNYNADTFSKNLQSVFAYIKQNGASRGNIALIMSEVAQPVVEQSKKINPEQEKRYKEFRDSVKTHKIKLNNVQREEIEYAYDSVQNFRKKTFGTLSISNEGSYLDEIWQELVEESGYMLDPDETDANMPLALFDAVQAMKPVPENVFGNSVKDAAYDLGLDIMSAYYAEQAQEAADQKLKERISKEKEKLTKAQQKWKDKYKAETKAALEEQKRQIQEERDNALKAVQKVIMDMDEEARNAVQSNDIAQACLIEEMRAEQEKKLRNLQEKVDWEQTKGRNRERQVKDWTESRRKNELKDQIEREWKKLDRMVENPTPQSHVPDRLLKSAMDVLALVNMDTGSNTIKNKYFRERLENLAEQYKKFHDEQKKLNTSAEFGDTYQFTDRTMNNIYMLQELFKNKSYADLKSSEMRMVLQIVREMKNEIKAANELFDNNYSNHIREVAGRSIEEVKEAKQKALYAGELIDGYLTMHLDSKREFRKLSGYQDNGAMMSIWQEFEDGQMKAITIQRQVFNMFREVSEGKNRKELEKLRSTKEKDLVECGLFHKGKPVMVSRAMRLAIIMHAQNDNNLRHICGNGLTIPNMKLYGKGDLKKAYNNAVTASYIEEDEWKDYMIELGKAKKNVEDLRKTLKDEIDDAKKAVIREKIKKATEYRDSLIEHMDERVKGVREKINAIAEHDLSDYEKQVLKLMKEFFWNYSGNQINATSQRMYDYSIARVGKYFPIHTNQDFVSKDFAALVQDARIEGNGSLKARTVSTAAIYLHDIFQEMLDQTDFVSKYAGFAIPTRDMNQVMNRVYQEYEQDELGQWHPIGEAHTLQQVVRDTWSNHDKDYLVNFLKDVNGSRATPGILTKAMNEMRSHYAGATLVANIGVAMKQAASFPTAGAVVGKRALLKSVKDIPKSISANKGIKELEERNPLLWYRSQGNIDEQYATAQNSWAIKIMPKWIKAVSVDLIGNIDAWTVRTLEYSAKYYVDMHTDLKKGSNEYWDAVSDTYTKLVTETQPNYTVLERPEILRDPDSFAKQLFMFKTQPLQNMQIMYDAMGECIANRKESKEVRKKSRQKLVNAVWSQCAAAFTFAGMSIIANLAYHKQWKYRDDDGKMSDAEIAKALRDGMISNFSGGLVFGDYIYSFINEFFMGGTNYGVDISIVEAFNTLTAGISNVKDFTQEYLDAETTADRSTAFVKMRSAVDDIMMSLAQFTGVPYNSMKNMFNSIVLYSQDIARGINTGVWSATSEFPSVYEKTETKVYGMDTQMDLIQKALDEGDTELAEKYAQEYADKSDTDSYETTEDVYKQVQSNKNTDAKEQYESGEMTYDEALQYWKDQGLEDAEAYKKVQQWESGGTYAKLTDEIGNMIESGETSGTKLQEIVKEYKENGLEDDSIRSSITSKYKEEYLNATGTEKATIKNILITAFVATGMTREDAKKRVEKWDDSSK